MFFVWGCGEAGVGCVWGFVRLHVCYFLLIVGGCFGVAGCDVGFFRMHIFSPCWLWVGVLREGVGRVCCGVCE